MKNKAHSLTAPRLANAPALALAMAVASDLTAPALASSAVFPLSTDTMEQAMSAEVSSYDTTALEGLEQESAANDAHQSKKSSMAEAIEQTHSINAQSDALATRASMAVKAKEHVAQSEALATTAAASEGISIAKAQFSNEQVNKFATMRALASNDSSKLSASQAAAGAYGALCCGEKSSLRQGSLLANALMDKDAEDKHVFHEIAASKAKVLSVYESPFDSNYQLTNAFDETFGYLQAQDSSNDRAVEIADSIELITYNDEALCSVQAASHADEYRARKTSFIDDIFGVDKSQNAQEESQGQTPSYGGNNRPRVSRPDDSAGKQGRSRSHSNSKAQNKEAKDMANHGQKRPEIPCDNEAAPAVDPAQSRGRRRNYDNWIFRGDTGGYGYGYGQRERDAGADMEETVEDIANITNRLDRMFKNHF